MAETPNSEANKRANNISRLRGIEEAARGRGSALLAAGVFMLGLGAIVATKDERDAARHIEITNSYYNTSIDMELAALAIGTVTLGGGAYALSKASRYGQHANLLEAGYEFNPLPAEDPAPSPADIQ